MRRIILFFLLCGSILPMMRAHAEAVTPAEARARAVDAEQTLIALLNSQVDEYFHQGKFDQCVSVLDRIIELNPIGVDPYTNAAWLLWSSGKNDEAKLRYERMVAANPTDPRGLFDVGLFYQRLKNDEEAVKWYKKAVEFGIKSPERHAYGMTLKRLGRFEEALAFWRQVQTEEPDNQIAAREIEQLTKEQQLDNKPDETPKE